MDQAAGKRVVERDQPTRLLIEDALRKCGYSVATAENADAALDHIIDGGSPGLILLQFPQADLELLQDCLVELCDGFCPPIVATVESEVTDTWLEKRGFCGFVLRPLAEDEVVRMVRMALAMHDDEP